ncbi:MAG: ArnT family glycosyltransferase [Francisella endosymbiont of Hyalomma asiaticum]
MNNKIKDILFVITVVRVAFCLYHVPNFYAPDETRYSEVAREMLANHNFIVPYIDGMIFFHKPPLVYWLTYIFMSILEYFGSKISKFSITRYILVFTYITGRKILECRQTALLS